MRVSILTDKGDIHTIEVDSQMELENIKALLEADVCRVSLGIIFAEPPGCLSR